MASATTTTLAGLRARSARTYSASFVARLRACRRTATAPATSRQRMYLSPRLLVRPSRSLPPEEFWRGVMPTRAALDVFLGILSRTVGANLLRLNGLVRLADDPDRPMVVHAVQHLMHPPTRLSTWPDEDRRTHLVVIGRGHDERAVAEIFQALIDGDGGADAVRPWRTPAFVVVFLLALSISAAILHSAGSNAVAAADHHVTSANGDRP